MSTRQSPFEGKIKDGGKCVCDLCGKTARLGGFLDPRSANPLVACYNCMMKISAKEQGISVAEAKKRRERMFKASNLFSQTKMKEYLQATGKDACNSIDELNEVIRYVTSVWNTFGKEAIEGFENMPESKLLKIYGKVKMNFSYLIKTPKHGRNDPCPCGSGKKYKKCCLLHDEMAAALVEEWKAVDSSVINKAMRLIEDSNVLDTKLLLEHYWGEKRLDSVREKGEVEGVAELEFNEWLMNDYYLKFEDAPYILAKLLADETLTSQQRSLVEARIKAPMTVWLVTHVVKGKGALIRNIFDQNEVFVYDRLFSESAQTGYLTCARVFNVGSYYLISGAYRAYPGNCSKEVREIIDEEYIKSKSSKDMNTFLRRHGYLFGRLLIKLQE